MLLPIILCGGSGTRLWPLSRESYPKQFLSLMGQKSLLQQTVLRMRSLSSDREISPSPVVVCNEEHRFLTAGQLLEIGIESRKILLEPLAKNTAPALTLAALQAASNGNDPVMLVMPSDHSIDDVEKFQKAVKDANAIIKKGRIITFGIVPKKPETGYGYIKYEPGGNNKFKNVHGFFEKPTPEKACQYINEGNYFWNSGIFMLHASTWIEAIEKANPLIAEKCKLSMQYASSDLDFIRPKKEYFENCPSDSIDYAVIEKIFLNPEWGFDLKAVPLSVGWSDLGAWDSIWDVAKKDDRGNALLGKNLFQQECNECLLMTGDRLMVGIGLKDLIVVDTPDALLVADKNKTQEIKKVVVDILGKFGDSVTKQNRKVNRPWGWYDSIDIGQGFQVKKIVVNPGATLSLQMHNRRAEHWVVVRGIAEIINGDNHYFLKENQSTYIPQGQKHRLSNPGENFLEIIEVQSGDYLGEDDIVRFDDVYGRVEKRFLKEN